MCFYLSPPPKKKPGRGASTKYSHSRSTYPSSRSSSMSRGRHRAPMPHNIVVHPPAPPPGMILPQVPPQTHQYPQTQPEVEETTNIFFPSPVPQQPPQFGANTGQFQQQNGQQGQGQLKEVAMQMQTPRPERRKSSVIIAEVEGIYRVARKIGDAVRRGSASSFGRRSSYQYQEERRGGREGRGHRREKSRSRSHSRTRSRSKSRERTSTALTRRDMKDIREGRLLAVDEEARAMARYTAQGIDTLMRETQLKAEAKRLAERKIEKEREREVKLEERVAKRLTGYTLGNIGYNDGRRRQMDWRENISWSPWNNDAVYENSHLRPPPTGLLGVPVYGGNAGPPPHLQNQTTSGRSTHGDWEQRGHERSERERERGGASNHIHVHTAPLVQGPQISTTSSSPLLGTAANTEAFGMNATTARRRQGSWVEPVQRLGRMIERGMGPYVGGVQENGMNGLGMAGLGGEIGVAGLGGGMVMGHMGIGMPVPQAVPHVVPVADREYQRARVYNVEPLGGMMY